ncbi:MAG: xanthine dehydrogenase family protein subunit M [Anaerolineales bacterium]|nr:xanthine dehydrogenase family protein subunit M [Anaerolineales bacterium]
MKPPPFEYVAPNSLEEALQILTEHGDGAKVLAGGQSLVPAMNFRMVQPTLLVDLNGIEELNYIRHEQNGELKIGAMTRQRQLELDETVKWWTPLLHETMPYIAHPQIRNRGTLGGTLVHADPAAELPVIAVAADARILLKSLDGERWVAAQDFFHGMFMTELRPEEILIEVAIPSMQPHTGWSFQEISRRAGDYAMMGVAALVSLDDEGKCTTARLVYLNAGDGPMDAEEAAGLLEGRLRSDGSIEEAAELAADKEIDPSGSVHATVSYQRHLARVLTRRALRTAFQRATESKGSEGGS